MADVVVYARVPWVTGNYITQTKMVQMDDDAEYNRQRSDNQAIPYNDFEEIETGEAIQPPVLDDITFAVKIDGSVVDSVVVTTGNGTVKLSNIDVSGFAKGLHTVSIEADIIGKTVRFVKSQDLEFLTVWANCEASETHSYNGSQYDYAITRKIKNISIINHGESQTW